MAGILGLLRECHPFERMRKVLQTAGLVFECVTYFFRVDKFSYLRGLLLEPARSAIAGFALTSVNYESAVELLKKRYGKKTAIQRALVNELLNARPVFNEGDTRRLRSFYDFAETKYRR